MKSQEGLLIFSLLYKRFFSNYYYCLGKTSKHMYKYTF